MSNTPSGYNTPRPHGHGHGQSRRLRQFLHPSGKKVHVANSPEEAATLKQRLEKIQSDEPFDIHIHGTPEHLSALRETQSHHERLRDAFRERHVNLYDEFENVRAELDALSTELNNITDHDVALDANFSKFGFSAHLRTHNEPGSSGNSVHGDSSSEKHDWDAERNNGRVMKFYKKPVVRQYFHKGLLWRASNVEEVASFELFVDLLYVGLIATIGDNTAKDPTGGGLLRFCIAFILSWKIWSDLTLVISWFETDDVIQRLSVLFIMTCLFGYTSNIVEAQYTTYPQLIAFYLTARMFNAAYFLLLAAIIPMMRAAILTNAAMIFFPSAIWIASVHVAEPQRQALIWIAIPLDLFGAAIIIPLTRGAKLLPKKWAARLAEIYDFYPGMNIEHKTARMDAFVTLVFGYSVVALIYQNKATVGINAFFGKATLGLIQAFTFNWLYFDVDGCDLFQHAIRRHVASSLVWITVHLPFIMSFVLASATLSRLVLAHDCVDANPDALSDASAANSESEITVGLRWFYCAGLGVALATLGVISMSHIHKDILGARVRKRHRLAVRFAVAVVLVCLPLAKGLDSLQLIATTTGLVVFVLGVDLYGTSCVGRSFFGGDRKCRYEAACPLKRRELENAIRTGEAINVEELASRMGGEKGVYQIN